MGAGDGLKPDVVTNEQLYTAIIGVRDGVKTDLKEYRKESDARYASKITEKIVYGAVVAILLGVLSAGMLALGL